MTLSLRHPRDLDDLLNYRLMRLFAAGGAPVVRLCEGRYGIARREWRILALLASGGPLSPSALAERANLDRARTSRAIGSLGAKELVRRSSQPGDRRRAVVMLSERGQHLYDELFPQVAAINERLLSVLDDASVTALEDAIEKLTDHAADVNRELVRDVHADRRRGGSRLHWPDRDVLS